MGGGCPAGSSYPAPNFIPAEILTALPLAGASLPFSVSSTTSFFSFKSLKGAKRKIKQHESLGFQPPPTGLVQIPSQENAQTSFSLPKSLGGGRTKKVNTTQSTQLLCRSCKAFFAGPQSQQERGLTRLKTLPRGRL